MSDLTVQVTLAGMGEVDMILHKLRNSLARRGPMHAQMAVYGRKITQKHLRDDASHASAARLGASPTGFRNKNAAVVEAHSDEEQATVSIPRNTGLGRAFRDVLIRPGSGKTYLTIPAHQATYGKAARPPDFPEGTFRFAIIQSWRTFTALVFRDGPYKGEVGFWLKREIRQKQDRTLLPTDEEYAVAARGAAVDYLTELLNEA
jgi:hypothetical protein